MVSKQHRDFLQYLKVRLGPTRSIKGYPYFYGVQSKHRPNENITVTDSLTAVLMSGSRGNPLP